MLMGVGLRGERGLRRAREVVPKFEHFGLIKTRTDPSCPFCGFLRIYGKRKRERAQYPRRRSVDECDPKGGLGFLPGVGDGVRNGLTRGDPGRGSGGGPRRTAGGRGGGPGR